MAAKKLQGQVAIVTGASRGIGAAAAMQLAQAGAGVILVARDELLAEKQARFIREQGGQAEVVPADVSDPESIEPIIEVALDQFRRIDILVNNAGIAGETIVSWETSLEEWHRVIGIDLTGTFLGCKAALPGMVSSGYGRIVNIASVAGKVGNQNAVAYSSAKAGVIGLTKAIAKDVMTKGVLINAVAPAAIETAIFDQVSPSHRDYIVGRVPMGRIGRVEEVAALTAWLCSDEVSFSNGATYDISGGLAQY